MEETADQTQRERLNFPECHDRTVVFGSELTSETKFLGFFFNSAIPSAIITYRDQVSTH